MGFWTARAAWSWDFGDGATSTAQNPSHQYADDGTYTVTLVVTDDDGDASAPYTQDVVVSNVAPTAAFTFAPASPIVGPAVAFTDGSTDPDGIIASYAWDFGDGGVSTDQNPAHAYSAAGTYTVSLTVTDDDGDTDTDTQDVTVSEAPNVAPTAGFTFSPPNPTDLQVISFTDTSSDSDGAVVAWSWDFGDGATSTTQNPTHQYADDGTYTVTLVVTDDDGDASAPYSQQLIVSNVAPTAGFTFTPPSPLVGQTVTFTETCTDADGIIVSYAWDFGDGATSTAENPTHAYASPGTFTVTLTVTDDDGATGTSTQDIIVLPAPNQPPTAGFTYAPTSPTDLDVISFTDLSSDPDPDGTVVAWAWDFGDRARSSAQNPTHQYADNGTYTVTLVVTDDDGARSAPFAQSIIVANVPPTAAFTYSPATPAVGDTVTFTDASTDPDGRVTSRAWDFGDGTTSSKQNPTHQYGVSGTFLVSLSATDNDGATGIASQWLTVLPGLCRVEIAQFSVPSRARPGQTGNLAVVVRNTGVVATDVQVQVQRILPLPATSVGSQVIAALAPGARVRLLFPYTYRPEDVPLATFRATATPLTPGGIGATAEASTNVVAR